MPAQQARDVKAPVDKGAKRLFSRSILAWTASRSTNSQKVSRIGRGMRTSACRVLKVAFSAVSASFA